MPGTLAAEFVMDDLASPVGTVWFRAVGNATIEILHSYVWPQVRRCGVRTAIHRALQQWYPGFGFMTAESSGPAAKAWLEKMGFVQGRDWTLDPTSQTQNEEEQP